MKVDIKIKPTETLNKLTNIVEEILSFHCVSVMDISELQILFSTMKENKNKLVPEAVHFVLKDFQGYDDFEKESLISEDIWFRVKDFNQDEIFQLMNTFGFTDTYGNLILDHYWNII